MVYLSQRERDTAEEVIGLYNNIDAREAMRLIEEVTHHYAGKFYAYNTAHAVCAKLSKRNRYQAEWLNMLGKK